MSLHSFRNSSQYVGELAPLFFFLYIGNAKCISGCCSLSIIRQERHSPHASVSFGFSHSRYLAYARARGIEPHPSGPHSICACAMRPCLASAVSLRLMSSCPMISLKYTLPSVCFSKFFLLLYVCCLQPKPCRNVSMVHRSSSVPDIGLYTIRFRAVLSLHRFCTFLLLPIVLAGCLHGMFLAQCSAGFFL